MVKHRFCQASFPQCATASINHTHLFHRNANSNRGELKFHQAHVVPQRQREVNQNKPDCFGELHFLVTSEDSTVHLQNESRGGVVALDSWC